MYHFKALITGQLPAKWHWYILYISGDTAFYRSGTRGGAGGGAAGGGAPVQTQWGKSPHEFFLQELDLPMMLQTHLWSHIKGYLIVFNILSMWFNKLVNYL